MKNRKQRLTLILSMLMIVTTLFSNSFTTNADSNPASWVLCKFEDGQIAYNAVATDLIPFTFRSKSAVSSTDDVDGGIFNGMLSLAGHNFKETNEHILGRELRPTEIPEIDLEEANSAAPKVSAFDRFGVAGLKWSSYLGEWKYYQIDACSKASQVSKTNFGRFYEGRQEPKSTFNDVGTSSDPRSIQFNKGVFASWGTIITDMIANGLFLITKLVVTFTITIVGLSFGDITSIIGLTSAGDGGVSASGVFTTMYNSLFTGFVTITFTLTALYLLYQGLFKRQFRLALNTLFKTILIFFVAVVMSMNPSYWIGIPNKVATAGQSLVLSAMSPTKTKNDKSLCSTDVSQIDYKIDGSDDFERINREMQSMIGCKLWSEMLFKPWVRGQFGVEYEELDASKLNNINNEWVGEAAVPIGGGEYINNWALFHLSTQTNAHAPIDGNLPTQITGVNSDWWRVADALSNYHEEKVTETPEGGVGSVTYDEQVKAEPLDMWQSWIGNNSTERIGIAFVSIIFGIIGSLGPMILGFTSAIMGAGITILMMVSPVFLLFGTWGGRGERIFLGWLSALVSTVAKKVLVSILLILSLSLTIAGMDLVAKVGILKAMAVTGILSVVAVRNRKTILNTLGNIDFGGIFNPVDGFNRAMDNINAKARRTSSVAVGAAAGAKASKDIGKTPIEGAKIGGFHQFRNVLYQTQFGMNVSREYDNTLQSGQYSSQERTCSLCGYSISDGMIAYRDKKGNYYCRMCGEDTGHQGLFEVVVDNQNMLTKNQIRQQKAVEKRKEARNTRMVDATLNTSWMSHSAMRDQMNSVVIGDKHYWDNNNVEGMIKLNIKRLHEDQAVFAYNKEHIGTAARPPSIPEPLRNYLDAPLMNEAWTQDNFEFIDEAYREAWTMWYLENSGYIENASSERRKEFAHIIKTYDPKIDGKEAIDKFIATKGELTKEYDNADEDLFIYRDGELISPDDSRWAEARSDYLELSKENRKILDEKVRSELLKRKEGEKRLSPKKPNLTKRD